MVVGDAAVVQFRFVIDRRRLMLQGRHKVLTSVDMLHRLGRRLGMNGAVVGDAAIGKLGAGHGVGLGRGDCHPPWAGAASLEGALLRLAVATSSRLCPGGSLVNG